MFGMKKDEKLNKSLNIDSLIGEGIKIIGKIEGNGNIRIDGIIEGDVDYKGSITLGETGKVKGNIICEDIIVAGEIKGNVNAKDKLTLLPTGNLIGDLEVESLVIHEKASFDGNCKMVTTNSNVKEFNAEKKNEKVKENK